MNLGGVPEELKKAIDALNGDYYGPIDTALSRNVSVPTLIKTLESHAEGQAIAPELLGVLQKIATFREQNPDWHRTGK